MCYRTGKYTVCRYIRASFSPDILHAGAPKGLNWMKVAVIRTYLFLPDSCLSVALCTMRPRLCSPFSEEEPSKD